MMIGINARYLRDDSLRGLNRYTFCLLKELSGYPEIELYLFTDDKSHIHPFFTSQLRARIVSLRSPKALLWEQFLLPRALKEQAIDVFHAPADAGLPYFKVSNYVLTYHSALDKSLSHRIKTNSLPGEISDFLDTTPGLKGRYLRVRHDFLRRLYISRADVIITVSHFEKGEIVNLLKVPEQKIRVIYEAPDEIFTKGLPEKEIEKIKFKYGLPTNYILYVGGYDRHKNVNQLLNVYAQLKKEGIREPLVLIGIGGDAEAAKSLASQLALEENREVFFLSRVGEDLPGLYQGAKLFVTLAWMESFCFPIVEAMASGTPIVASSFGAIPEILDDGGIVVDPTNSDEIVRHIKEILSNADFQLELKRRALRRATFFSFRKTAEETVRVYETLLEQRHEGRAPHSRRP